MTSPTDAASSGQQQQQLLHQWRSFFFDIPPNENAILAEFNPDFARDEVVIVTESLKVRWHDTSKNRVAKAASRSIDPPRGMAKATAAALFRPPEPVRLARAPCATETTSVPGAGESSSVSRGVRFDDDNSPQPSDATRTALFTSCDPAIADAPPQPVGAIGTANGDVLIFTNNEFVAGFKLKAAAPVKRICVVEPLRVVGGEIDAVNADLANSKFNSTIDSLRGPTSPGTDVELRTEPGGPVLSGGSHASATGEDDGEYLLPQDPQWYFSLAVLDTKGDVSILQPKFARPRNRADGSYAVPVQKTLIHSLFAYRGVRDIAADENGVAYYCRGGSNDVTLVPGDDLEMRHTQSITLSASLRKVRAIDTFRHLVVALRGTIAYQTDFRANRYECICDTGVTGDYVHISYPAVFVGCSNGAIVVLSLLARAVIARTATYSQTLPRSIRYDWARGIATVVDSTGAVDMLEAPAGIRKHVRGPLCRMATGRVLRRAVELESLPSVAGAKAAERLLLERFVVPEEVGAYLGRSVLVP
jgi:hypothetical protein